MSHPIIRDALNIMEQGFKQGKEHINGTQALKDYVRLQIGAEKEEVFMILFLNCENRLIATERVFRGSIQDANVRFRPVARLILEHNAARIILAHNHPSGNVNPSDADIHLTRKLNDLTQRLDCPVLDHVIVAPNGAYSFRDNGFCFV